MPLHVLEQVDHPPRRRLPAPPTLRVRRQDLDPLALHRSPQLPLLQRLHQRQIHDRGPDERRQAVPPCDQLLESRALPAPIQQAQAAVDTNAILKNSCDGRNADAIPAGRSVPIAEYLAGLHLAPLDRWQAERRRSPSLWRSARRSHRPTRPIACSMLRCVGTMRARPPRRGGGTRTHTHIPKSRAKCPMGPKVDHWRTTVRRVRTDRLGVLRR